MSVRELKSLGINPAEKFSETGVSRKLRSTATHSECLKKTSLSSTSDTELLLTQLAKEYESDVEKDYESSVFNSTYSPVCPPSAGNGGVSHAVLESEFISSDKSPESELVRRSVPSDVKYTPEEVPRKTQNSSVLESSNAFNLSSISGSISDPMAPVRRPAFRRNNRSSLHNTRSFHSKGRGHSTGMSRNRGFGNRRNSWRGGRNGYGRFNWRDQEWDRESYGRDYSPYRSGFRQVPRRFGPPRRNRPVRQYYNSGFRGRKTYQNDYEDRYDRRELEYDEDYDSYEESQYDRSRRYDRRPREREYRGFRSGRFAPRRGSRATWRRREFEEDEAGDYSYEGDEEEEVEPQVERRRNRKSYNKRKNIENENQEGFRKPMEKKFQEQKNKNKKNKQKQKKQNNQGEPEEKLTPDEKEDNRDNHLSSDELEISGTGEEDVYMERDLTVQQCRETIYQKFSVFQSRSAPSEKGKEKPNPIDFVMRELEETQSLVHKIQLQNELLKTDSAEGRLRAAEALREARSNQILIFGQQMSFEESKDAKRRWAVIKEVLQKIMKIKLTGPFKIMGHYSLPFERDNMISPTILVKFNGCNIYENMLRRFQLKKTMQEFHSTEEGMAKRYAISENLPKVLEDRRKLMEDTIESMSMFGEMNRPEFSWSVSRNFGIRKTTWDNGKIVSHYTYSYKKAIEEFKAYLPGTDKIPI